MDNLGAKFDEILQNPETIKQIASMASALGLTDDPDGQIQTDVIPREMMNQLSGILKNTEAKDKKQQTLIRALLPYLSPKRQARLERAMHYSHISRLAGAALRGSLFSNLQGEETHV